MELVTLERVCLEVEQREPDPHRGQYLDQRQPPVREQQLQALKEHDEGTDREHQWREYAPRAAEIEDGRLDRGLVACLDRANEHACLAREDVATRGPLAVPAGPIRGLRRHVDPSIGSRGRSRIALAG